MLTLNLQQFELKLFTLLSDLNKLDSKLTWYFTFLINSLNKLNNN